MAEAAIYTANKDIKEYLLDVREKKNIHQKHIMIIAGEPSGDIHGANLIKELMHIKQFSVNNQSLIITGIGGDLMAHAGMELFFHIKDLSVMGVIEVIMQFRNIKLAFDLFRKKIAPEISDYEAKTEQTEPNQEQPDLLILIDYPGFNLKAAAYAKKRKIPVLYYITPKVWAWNRSRLKKIKQYVDHAALIFPFEEAIFKKEKIPATFVGHPLLDYYNNFTYKDSEPAYQYSGLLSQKSESSNDNELIIGLLPGSRESEISNLLEIMLESAIIIRQKLSDEKYKKVVFLVSAASSVNIDRFNSILKQYNQGNLKQFNKAYVSDHDNIFEVIHGEPTAIFRRCDLLIAASGTVTLEAAIRGLPMVIVYKTSSLTYFLAKNFVKIPYVGLPNIIAKYPVVPELLQNDATPEKVSNQVLSMVNPETLASIRKRLLMLPRYLGGAGAAERTAKIAMQMLAKNMSVANNRG